MDDLDGPDHAGLCEGNQTDKVEILLTRQGPGVSETEFVNVSLQVSFDQIRVIHLP